MDRLLCGSAPFMTLLLLLFCSTLVLTVAEETGSAFLAGANETNATVIDSVNGIEEDGLVYDEHGEHYEPVLAVLLPWFVQAIGVLAFYVLTRYLHAIPYTAVLFTVGLFMGVGAARSGFEDQLTESIGMWVRIDSEVLFCVFLPGLLFKDALEINFYLFQESFWQLLLLAFPMVLAGTLLTACVALYIFPYDWSFHLALTFGSILAATDPVAVAALLNEVGAPPRLKMHISGESLLNDGSAVVFFTVFSGLFLAELDLPGGQEASVSQGFITFLRMSLGGAAVGIAYAFVLIVVLHKLDRRLEQEETVLQVAATVTAAYLSFYTSEVVCHMSGVIAVVTCGILTKAFGGGLISDWQVMNSFWTLVEHLLNTILFALGGIEFGSIISGSGNRDWGAQDWGYLIILYIFLTLIRFFLNFAFYPIVSRIGLKSNLKENIFSSFAGLRGAVGIALAIALDSYVISNTDDPDKRRITTKVFGMVGGIAFLTLIINGPLSGPLLTHLKLADSSESRKRIIDGVNDAIKNRTIDDFIFLMTDPRFFFVDFALIRHHCPRLKNITAKELETAIEANKQSVNPNAYKTPELAHVLPYIEHSAPIRAQIEAAKRSVFMGSASLPKILTVDEDIELEEGAAEAKPSLELLTDIRLMFVELLRSSYQAQIRDGELDPREFNGYLVYVLLQSLDFAHESVSKGGVVDDWKASHLTSSEMVNKTEAWFRKPYDYIYKKIGVRGSNAEEPGNMEHLHFMHLRLDVMRAFSFIDAHKEAQERLNDEFGSSEGEIKAAFRVVLNESKRQVRKAKEILKSKNKKQLKHVISHHLCMMLQNKTARYVQLLFDSGVLLQREARHYLEEIDENIHHIRKCNLDKHPGSIDFADEGDFFTVNSRRKRVKQKSIL